MNSLKNNWESLVFFLGGIIWLLRTFIENQFQPALGNPQSTLDYVAIVFISLSFIMLAIGLWLLYRNRKSIEGLTRIAWIIGIGIAIVSALVIAVATFAEYGLGIEFFANFAFVVNGLIIGLVIAGFSAIRPVDIPRISGWLLLACAMGIFFPEQGGGFLIGFSLGFLGYSLL